MILDLPHWREDLAVNSNRKNGFLKPLISWYLDPSFACVILLRLTTSRRDSAIRKAVARLASRFLVRWFGCHVSVYAKVGRRISIPHPVGIVIGEGAVIGDDVTIFQHVTIGRKSHLVPDYPKICDGSTIYAGAVLLGGISIGPRASVGANSVVTKDVAENTNVAGVPAKVIVPKAITSP